MKNTGAVAITDTWLNSKLLMSEFFRSRVWKLPQQKEHVKNTSSAVEIDKLEAEEHESHYVQITTNNSNKSIFVTVYGLAN